MSRSINERLARLACRLAEFIACTCSPVGADRWRASSLDLRVRWDRLQRQQKLAAKAIDRGWFQAARHVLTASRFDRHEFDTLWEKHCGAVDEFLGSSPEGLSEAALYAELLELNDEFESVGWDKNFLWVTTESITLEDVYLGPFDIKLRLDRIGHPGEDDDFEIKAIDPHPAGGDGEVTHPHVSGGRICQGDAKAPIRLALRQGRLTDVFQLNNAVLTTYNPGSPFVKLEDWDGVRCTDCDSSVPSEDTSYCEACGDDYCDECSTCCPNCDVTRCMGCLIGCTDCGEGYCSSCLSPCKACKAKGLCVDCLEEDLCASCRDAQAKENHDVDDNQTTDERETAKTLLAKVGPEGATQAADTGVHTNSLAQTPVSLPCG